MSEEQVVNNLMFAASNPPETMRIAMRPEDAKRWFGLVPPDLSLIARRRGPTTCTTSCGLSMPTRRGPPA